MENLINKIKSNTAIINTDNGYAVSNFLAFANKDDLEKGYVDLNGFRLGYSLMGQAFQFTGMETNPVNESFVKEHLDDVSEDLTLVLIENDVNHKIAETIARKENSQWILA